jgi:hypothetical protein
VSIIYDALQKTQQLRQNDQKEQPSMDQPFRHFLKNRTMILFALALVLLAVNFTLYLPAIKAYFQPKPVTVLPKPKPPSIAAAYKRTHTLNGVFLSRQETVAMINNSLIHVGDQLDGMTVTAINEHSVKLKNAYEVILLTSRA